MDLHTQMRAPGLGSMPRPIAIKPSGIGSVWIGQTALIGSWLRTRIVRSRMPTSPLGF